MSPEIEKENTIGETEQFQRVMPVFPIYSAIIIACLVAVSVCQFIVDGKDSIVMGSANSVEIAGFVKDEFAAGQYWRILTGAVLHGGLIHLIFNCYAFYALGRIFETLSNRNHLTIVFLLAAISGGILSFVFLPGSSVGASGGILGFLGYLTIYGFKRRKIMTSDFLNNMIFNIIFIALMGAVIIPWIFKDADESQKIVIDNYGHLGGLLAGMIYGLLQIPGDIYKDPRQVGKLTEIGGLVSLGIIIAVSVFSILLLLQVI